MMSVVMGRLLRRVRLGCVFSNSSLREVGACGATSMSAGIRLALVPACAMAENKG